MDLSALVDEIARRVSEKLEAAGPAPQRAPAADAAKPALLVLTQEHGTVCHEMLEHPKLNACYRLACAKLADYACDMRDYEAVILFDLTVEALAKLAGGMCDTPFTALAQRAILLGKKIFVPTEAVELLTLQKTVPSAYYQMLRDQLTLLENSGVSLCPADALADAILSGETAAAVPVQATASVTAARTVAICKKVVTERDIAGAYDRDVRTVRIGQKAIVTDLAREYAAARGLLIVRD